VVEVEVPDSDQFKTALAHAKFPDLWRAHARIITQNLQDVAVLHGFIANGAIPGRYASVVTLALED
jgi:hypothetical protein